MANNLWNEIRPVLSEHEEWFHSVLEMVLYPQETESREFYKPLSYALWATKVSNHNLITPEVIEKLSSLHGDLIKIAEALITQSKKIQDVPYYLFRDFMTIYEEFMLSVRRLEEDFTMENSGFDFLTGLRSAKLLLPDLKREMDRYARNGKSFVLVLARIDMFDYLVQKVEKSECEGYIKLFSNFIKISIRSFDDAYYLGGGKFFMCLKQVDIKGGLMALERLKDEIGAQEFKNDANDMMHKLTMSFCITEPSVDENLEHLIESLDDDLNVQAKDQMQKIIEYIEVSPLKKYVTG